jgi:CheY-like chemotaxis protein
MVQAAAFTYPVGSIHTGPGNPTPQIVPPALGGGGSRLLTSPLVGGPSGVSPVYDADEMEQEPVLGPGEVISELARLKAEMGANIVWLLDPNTPPAVRSSLVKSRGFVLLVLRPLHAGRLSEIMRKVGVVRERRRELDQARKNMEAQCGPAAGGAAEGQSVPPSPSASLTEESSVTSQPGEEIAKPVLPKGPKVIGAGTLRGFHILVVEDSAVLQKLVTSMLEKMGAKVAQASDGQQAVAIAEELRDSLDVILMDCQVRMRSLMGCFCGGFHWSV